MSKWSLTRIDNEWHIAPINDLVMHTSEDCVCMPIIELTVNPVTGDNYLYTHYSLDGRELKEKEN